MKGRGAFTLPEVLITLGIISLLATMLIAMIQPAIQRANAARATGNLKQLAQAEFAYAADNKECYTPGYSPATPAVWQSLLLPYVYPSGYKGQYRSDPHSIFNVPDASLSTSGVCSIGLNDYLGSVNRTQYWNYQALTVQHPSSIILLGEMVVANNDYLEPPDASLGGSPPGFRRNGNKDALMAFCDGHVEALGTNALDVNQKTNYWHWW